MSNETDPELLQSLRTELALARDYATDPFLRSQERANARKRARNILARIRRITERDAPHLKVESPSADDVQGLIDRLWGRG